MKTALIHDWLVNLGGAEKVLEAIYEIYPSPIYTLLSNKERLKGTIFERAEIINSFIQKMPMAGKIYRKYLVFFPLAIEQFDLSSYDLIISSSHAIAKGVLRKTDQIHICYCHTPIRYGWDLYHVYMKESGLKRGLRGLIAKIILHYIRIWDQATVNRVDYFIANSRYTKKRINKHYGREAVVIYPPVDVDCFELYTKKEDFYLTVSRMVPYKRIDIIVEAFNRIPERRLVIIGEGPTLKSIKSKARSNIEILGFQPFSVLRSYMERARAFVFAAEEDFGIAPVEAMACGTPVIAYGKGGIIESVLEGRTGLFFGEQTPESVIMAIRDFERLVDKMDPFEIRKNAERFSRERFKREFKEFVEEKTKGL